MMANMKSPVAAKIIVDLRVFIHLMLVKTRLLTWLNFCRI